MTSSYRTPRPYQTQFLADIRAALARGQRPLAVLPTGGGKTVCFARFVAQSDAPCVVVAHRRELVAQISLSLARDGVMHRILAPPPTVRACAAANAAACGTSYVDPMASHGVASVDSVGRAPAGWAASIRYYIQDEAHHLLTSNKWGRALDKFPRATPIGFSATPERADGKGLGAHADGVFDALVPGPDMRSLIDAGYLADYRLATSQSDALDLSRVDVSRSTGDYSSAQLRTVMRGAKIHGDVVAQYRAHAEGMLGVTFAVDVDAATVLAEAYCAAGIPAAVVSAKTPAAERTAAIRKFARRELIQLVNVDLFGEGFDLASAAGMDVCIDVVSMARPTQSFVVYAQQFGRALRTGPGKSRALILDHVGNIMRHQGPPDMPRPMSLDGRERRSSGQSDDVPRVRVCTTCTGPYPIVLSACPYCGASWEPAGRGTIEQVDGDLTLLDPAVLAELRAMAAERMAPDSAAEAYARGRHMPEIGVRAHVKRHRESRDEQAALRDAIARWAGARRAAGDDDGTIYRRFHLEYGISVVHACGLTKNEALALRRRLEA